MKKARIRIIKELSNNFYVVIVFKYIELHNRMNHFS